MKRFTKGQVVVMVLVWLLTAVVVGYSFDHYILSPSPPFLYSIGE